MKAVMYRQFGSADVLQFGELPAPVPNSGQVLVRIRAASVNVIDSRVRAGLMGPLVNKKFPKVPGADFSGIVEAVAPDVVGFKIGDEVFGAVDPLKGGAWAEAVSVPQGQLAMKPAALTFEEAAAVPVAGLAALLSVRNLGGLRPGDDLLVHGASGGVGLFAVQLAKHVGARVVAVTGPSGVAAVRAAGADTAIDYTSPNAMQSDRRFDVIINASGKCPFATGRRFLKPSGRLIEPSPTIPVFIGSKIANLFRRQKHLVLQTVPRSEDLTHLASLLASGDLKVSLAKTYPWSQFRAAVEHQEKGGVVGKISVTIAGN